MSQKAERFLGIQIFLSFFGRSWDTIRIRKIKIESREGKEKVHLAEKGGIKKEIENKKVSNRQFETRLKGRTANGKTNYGFNNRKSAIKTRVHRKYEKKEKSILIWKRWRRNQIRKLMFNKLLKNKKNLDEITNLKNG